MFRCGMSSPGVSIRNSIDSNTPERTGPSGKVKTPQAGKRHGMRKRTNRFIRNARGSTMMDDVDVHRIVQYMPYGSK